MKISNTYLRGLYLNKLLSSKEISQKVGCSVTKIDYWLRKFGIPKRHISEAVYIRKNPKGDPFSFKQPKSVEDAFLYGLGLGLYWGEGTKSNKSSVRIGNSDPKLIKVFMNFLSNIYKIDESKLRFGLQIFSDSSSERILTEWQRKLGVSRKQFYKVIVTPSRGGGTYKNKAKYGVLTLYLNNTKLRNLICEAIEKI